MRAADESTEQRLERWLKLRNHLRDKGLNEAPPADCLLEPEPTTRPNLGLVAYYDEIMQKSPGANRLAGVGTLVAFAAFILAVFGLMEEFPAVEMSMFVNSVLQAFFKPLPWLPLYIDVVLFVIALSLAVAFAITVGRESKRLVVREDRLCLTLEKLILSLPDGKLHTPWFAVYSASVDQERKWFSRRWPWVGRKKLCVQVELDDGKVAWLYPDAAECEPLTDLMTDFVLCARNGGRPLRERAAASEVAN